MVARDYRSVRSVRSRAYGGARTVCVHINTCHRQKIIVTSRPTLVQCADVSSLPVRPDPGFDYSSTAELLFRFPKLPHRCELIFGVKFLILLLSTTWFSTRLSCCPHAMGANSSGNSAVQYYNSSGRGALARMQAATSRSIATVSSCRVCPSKFISSFLENHDHDGILAAMCSAWSFCCCQF